MKNTLTIAIAILLTSCGKYVTLNRENYEILNRGGGGNILKIVAKFEKNIEIDYILPDTIVATVNEKGTSNFNTVTRYIDKIPAGAKVKIKDAEENRFTAEFIDYKMSLPMIRLNDEYVIMTSKENIIGGTRYVVKDNDPHLLVKIRKSKSKQYISLKK
jgi:hypothetical protein